MFTTKNTAWLSSCVLVVVLLMCRPAAAQNVTGSISGTVLDQSAAVVPGADVTLTNEQTGETRKNVSSDNGEFVFAAVVPGTYTVKVEKSGFQSFQRTGITLTLAQRLPLGRIQLTVGEMTQTITVSQAGDVVNTQTADMTGTLAPKQLDLLVIKGRDPMGLLRTLPGATTGTFGNGNELSDVDPGGGQSLGGVFGSLTPNMNGARLWWQTITVDGQVGSNQDWPGLFESAVSVESVSEMKVTTNNYSAEYGRNLGATVTVVTKGGTKDFHGTGYWFKRHEMFNANGFFENRDGLPKPLFRYSSFGGAIGGPIYIPNKFNTSKEKLFFFYSHEEWLQKNFIPPFRLTVPTGQERAGDFSRTLDQDGRLIPIIDPLTRQAFPGNIIPPGRINRNGQVLLSMLPLPNRQGPEFTSAGYNYEWQDVCETPKRMQALKTDYNPNRKDKISIGLRRWWSDDRAYTCFTIGYANLPLLKHHYNYSTDNAQVSWTRILSPSKVNEFTIGVVGEKERGQVPGPYPDRATTYFDPVTRSKLGYTLGQFFPQANPFGFIPQASYGGVPNVANVSHDNRLPGDQGYLRYNASDYFSWIRGPHAFKFGLDFEWNYATDGEAATCGDGCFNFGRDPNNPGDANWPYATALLGNFTSYIETSNRPKYRYQRQSWEWYAQDIWKATRKLSLSYGVRFAAFTNWNLTIGTKFATGSAFVPSLYDRSKVSPLFRPALDANGKRVAQDPTTGQLFPAVYIGAFVPGVGNPFAGTVGSNDPSYPRDYQNGQPVQIAPRFGFSYDVFGNGKTAIRGGFGVTKLTQPTYGGSSGRTIFNAPSQLNPQIFYGNMDTFLQSGSVLFPSSTGAFEKDYNTASAYNYSLSIQRDIGFNTVLDVSYVGNVGRHLLQTVNLNTLPYGTRFLPQNIDPTTGRAYSDVFLRPNLGYQNITYRQYNGFSNYNSLQVAANRRFTGGVQFGVAYTWSKTMGTGSGEAAALPLYLSTRVWAYGPTSWDQTHILVVNYIWELPKVSKFMPSPANPVVRQIFDNWQISGISSFASGFPRTVGISTTDNADITGGGDGVRPLMVAAPKLSHGDRTFERWFNTAAFARPPQGNQGDEPVGAIRGPGVNNWDLTVIKHFPFKEGRFLEFRWEMYNAFNHAQFSQVDTTARFNPAGQQVNGRFGRLIEARPPRIMQLGLKFTF